MKTIFLSLFLILFSFSFPSQAQLTKAELLQKAVEAEAEASRFRELAARMLGQVQGMEFALNQAYIGVTCQAAEQAAERLRQNIKTNKRAAQDFTTKAREFEAYAGDYRKQARYQ